MVASRGHLWSSRGQTLYQLHEGAWRTFELTPLGEPSIFYSISKAEMGPDGTVWAAVEDTGLARIKDGELSWIDAEDGPLYFTDLIIGPDNMPWTAHGNEITHLNDGEWETLTLNNVPGIAHALSAVADSAGQIWFGGNDGLTMLDNSGTWQTFPQFTGRELTAFTETAENDLLAAGCLGVYQLTDGEWQLHYEGVQFHSAQNIFEKLIMP